VTVGNASDLFYPFNFTICLGMQETVCGMVEDEALVDHPPPLVNAGSLKVCAQALCLQHGSRLWQGDDDKLRLAFVAQAWQKPLDGNGRVALAVGNLSVVALRRVEQQQSMTRGRGVDDYDLIVGLHHDLGKTAEDGNLLGTRAAQVFLDVGEVGHTGLASLRSDLFFIT